MECVALHVLQVQDLPTIKQGAPLAEEDAVMCIQKNERGAEVQIKRGKYSQSMEDVKLASACNRMREVGRMREGRKYSQSILAARGYVSKKNGRMRGVRRLSQGMLFRLERATMSTAAYYAETKDFEVQYALACKTRSPS
eukprot:1151490-Pelagomonas_calceolata.AAC.5